MSTKVKNTLHISYLSYLEYEVKTVQFRHEFICTTKTIFIYIFA